LTLSVPDKCGFLAVKDFSIVWISTLVVLSLPDQGYFRNASYALNG